ncbi:hypothetical protein OZD70_04380 [Wolbachia endosymbiont of Drosophila tsacasi]|nr:hypothetical protein [Wolbachia endosymbiont of Drosophila tsacasi]MDE5062477.1 hypothetical protein [Wolbachia endosymbiont of Drosophila tsacasi]
MSVRIMEVISLNNLESAGVKTKLLYIINKIIEKMLGLRLLQLRSLVLISQRYHKLKMVK